MGKRGTESEKERRNKLNKKKIKKTDTKIRIAANMLVLVKEKENPTLLLCVYRICV